MLVLILSSLLPMEMTAEPKDWGMFSYYMIFTLLMTAIIMASVGFSIFKTCVKQLFRGFNVNMITLISVGSGLAFGFGTGYFIAGFFSEDPDG